MNLGFRHKQIKNCKHCILKREKGSPMTIKDEGTNATFYWDQVGPETEAR